ncbi:hypothetical protein MRB53_037916 [Persea americana]|nr:hypothetical protein MRB53_037916 [Persea americana]
MAILTTAGLLARFPAYIPRMVYGIIAKTYDLSTKVRTSSMRILPSRIKFSHLGEYRTATVSSRSCAAFYGVAVVQIMSEIELMPVVAGPSTVTLSGTRVDDQKNSTQHQHVEEEEESPNDERIEQGLAPTDGGLAAWRLLAAAFMFEALLWGILLQDARVRRQSLHTGRRYSGVRPWLSGCAVDHACDPAVPEVAEADDMGRMYVSPCITIVEQVIDFFRADMHRRTRPRLICFELGSAHLNPRRSLRSWVPDFLLSNSESGQ